MVEKKGLGLTQPWKVHEWADEESTRADIRETRTFCRTEKELGKKLGDLHSEAQLRTQVRKNDFKIALDLHTKSKQHLLELPGTGFP